MFGSLKVSSNRCICGQNEFTIFDRKTVCRAMDSVHQIIGKSPNLTCNAVRLPRRAPSYGALSPLAIDPATSDTSGSNPLFVVPCTLRVLAPRSPQLSPPQKKTNTSKYCSRKNAGRGKVASKPTKACPSPSRESNNTGDCVFPPSAPSSPEDAKKRKICPWSMGRCVRGSITVLVLVPAAATAAATPGRCTAAVRCYRRCNRPGCSRTAKLSSTCP